ncbi:hypothetical protein DPMN_183136 [Dreissena polymorpha]|uniref:LRAT domain-containing protein n=1 Tax=Dreissena polymorpha TaxID=45954 RepID=A0A9D4DIH9_DREPO|nr:hypothetical protein DPMN_183136 [Dreissena polymorpha]
MFRLLQRRIYGCTCNEESLVEYKDDEELLGVRCRECCSEWLDETFITDSNDRKCFKDYNGTKLYFHKHNVEQEPAACDAPVSRKQICEGEMGSLSSGDHIMWHRSKGGIDYYHHAIVQGVNVKDAEINVIHYQKPDYNGLVQEDKIPFTETYDLFKIIYSTLKDTTKLILARARSFLGEKGYGIFTNNCESLAKFCITGVRYSVQVQWLREKGKEIAVFILAKSSFAALTEGTKAAISEAIEHMMHATDNVGLLLFSGLEGCFVLRDSYNILNSFLDGKSTGYVCIYDIVNRFTEAGSGITLAYWMGLFGQFVGTSVGGPLCGWLGSAIMTALGALIGKKLGRLIVYNLERVCRLCITKHNKAN